MKVRIDNLPILLLILNCVIGGFMKKPMYVSPSVINRLPKYLACLQEVRNGGVERISSAQIAKKLGFTPSQVRQDLSTFGNYGAQGYGYNVQQLEREIESILGVHERHEVVIVGVGSIGRALLEHMDFGTYNFCVRAGFDIDPNLIGTTVNGIEIKAFEELELYLKQNQVDICILTVSGVAAKSVAALMYKHGVCAIWNFTNESLGLEDTEVIVQNLSFWESLFTLTYYLEEKYRQRSFKNCVNK